MRTVKRRGRKKGRKKEEKKGGTNLVELVNSRANRPELTLRDTTHFKDAIKELAVVDLMKKAKEEEKKEERKEEVKKEKN